MAPSTLSVSDLLTLRGVADPAIRPGGDVVVATVTRSEAADPPRYASRIHAFDVATGAERELTHGDGKDAQPAFSPDGSALAFVSDRHGATRQLFVLPLAAGGEARRLSDFPAGVDAFAWHGSGSWCAVVSRGQKDPDLAGLARVIRQPYYRQDGVGFRPERPAQLWKVTIDGVVTQLTDLPTSVSDLHVGPDGTLWFVAAHDLEAEGYYYRDVWRLDEGALAPAALVDQANPLIAGKPSVAPDGSRVAFLAPSDPQRISSPTGVWVMASSGGRPRLLTGEFDCVPLVGGDSRWGRYPYGPVWLDDDTLLCLVNRRGSGCVARVDVASGDMIDLQDAGRVVTGFVAQPGLLAFTAETSDRPGELFVQVDGTERKLSRLNDAWVERHRPIAMDPEVVIPSDDGAAEIAYWTLTPPEPRADHAMVLQIHGGPRTMYGHGFSFEMQLMAARGYTVVFGNPRGGAGYGYAFSESIAGRVGSIDADDVLAIATDARRKHTRPDAPMHVTGGSYGGFMTNWLITRTDAFASAVTQRSISNWLSFYGTSDVGFSWLHIETGGNPWENTQSLWDKSPMKHVANVTTPLLIVHAEQDHRCPIEQAEQFFVALKVIGKAPVEFIRFPDEGHDLSRSGRPDRRIQRLEAILAWFERHPGSPDHD